MKTEWDYTYLAEAYLKRPEYSPHAIKSMLSIAGCNSETVACDIGAGVAHLTLELAKNKFRVEAIEPNNAMRAIGIERTKEFKNVKWSEATGENTNKSNNTFDLVTFGSSFNVCDRELALKESKRILKDKGWFACMWNHRDLSCPIQAEIESIIKTYINDYSYGSRRENQSEVISKSCLFDEVISLSSKVIHFQSSKECIEAWKSHATLERQAKEKFKEIISAIEFFINNLNKNTIEIPYETKIWMAQTK